jgi:hypothetical protein
MPVYECKRCSYSTKNRKIFENHLNKKILCKPVYSNADRSLLLTEFDEYKQKNLKCGILCGNTLEYAGNTLEYAGNKSIAFICDKCNKIFKQKRYLEQHRNRNNKCTIGRQEKKIDLEKQEIFKLKSNILSTTINNNGDTNNNTLNNKIKSDVRVNLYGKEHFSYITPEAVKRCHICPYDSIPRLASDIFFNKNHPENRNVNWSNKKKPLMQILQRGDDGPEWVNKDKSWVLEDMNDKAYNIIDCEYKPLTTTLTEPQKIHYEQFQDDYDTHNKNTLKRLSKETERLILNYKLSGFT